MNLEDIHSDDIYVRAPDYLYRLAQTKSPAREYFILQRDYSEIISYLIRDEPIPFKEIEMCVMS